MTGDGLTVEDQQEMHNLVIETLWRVDHGQGEACHELWVDDGEIWYEGKRFCKGREELKEWGRQRLPPESVRHLATNLRFEADGTDAATGTGVEIVFYAPERRNGPEATLPSLVGEWSFRFARTAEGWRFSYINFDRLFDRREQPDDLF
jgi:hypothetical protein